MKGEKHMKKVVTYGAVKAVCEKLRRERRPISIHSVRELIGGSYTTIARYINQWHEECATRSRVMSAE
jgi:hypothetical protein